MTRLLMAAALCVCAAACAPTPSPPYTHSFSLSGPAPRILVAAHETTVPVTLTNTGSAAWDRSRVHLSYHWLWLLPREITARSRWNVPYHNGIRTELTETIPAGGVASVQGRVEAPRWPGVYWIQWDMVEEGVTWFSQVSPRQRRSLVLVLPPAVWLFAPIPLIVAVGGLVAIRRRGTNWFADSEDAVWCTAALLCKPLIVVDAALLEPTRVAYWLMIVAALLPSLAGLFLSRRVRPWILVGVGILGSLIVLGDVIYYRFFGDVLSAPAILAARQTGHLWGSIRSLFSPVLIWIVADWPFAILLARRLSATAQRPRFASAQTLSPALPVIVAAILATGIWLSRITSSPALGQMFRDRAVVEQLGLFGFHAYDVWNYARATWLRHPATADQIYDALTWFVERAPMRASTGSPAFAAARGRNLIVVQVESLQDYVVDFHVRDQRVMPHLAAWIADSVRFANVTDETSEGRTSDAEFTTMASLLPLEHGAVAFRFPGNHYIAMPKILAEHGYATLSAVAFEPGFWNRQVMHPSYGFQKSLFEPDFQMTEQIGWGLNDRDFLQQMIPHLEALPRPFAAWLITLSLHHPFEDFPAAHKVLDLGPLEGTSFGNYLHTMHFFDDALEQFKIALAREGLLDGTVLVVLGDHDAGFVRDAELARTLGIGENEAAWAMNDRVPLFIRVPQPSGANPPLVGVSHRPAGQTDLAPTVLCLLGIDASPLPYVGRNLFSAAASGPVPRPYGEWIDDHHLYLSHGGGADCLDPSGRLVPDQQCADADRLARREREVSRLVVTADLQSRLREMMTR